MRTVAVLLLVSACQSGQDAGDDPLPSQLPPIKVDLPPPVTFVESKIPESYPDQTLSIHGVRKKASEYLDRDVRVKALLVEVYRCPCPKGKVSDTCGCDQPHFWIADETDTTKDKAMLVADMPYDDRTGKDKKLELLPGTRYIVDGTFAKQSNTGFSSSEGLLIYKAHAPEDGEAGRK